MERTLQILLILALIPTAGFAREETMAERRQRIMRKYLRERQVIAQSDLFVPETALEDERVVDSKKYIAPQVGFERHEGGVVTPSAAPRPVPRPVAQNWLLDDAAAEEDSNANPFSTDSRSATGTRDSWSRWGSGSTSRGQTDNGSRYSSGSFSSGSSSSQPAGGRRTDIFGQPLPEANSDGGLGLSGPRSYGASPSSGLLQSPFSTRGTPSPDSSPTLSPSGYTPYKSPYQTQLDQRNQPQQDPQPEYKRTAPYEQWKDKSKTWDPTKDDAYLNELMKRNRR